MLRCLDLLGWCKWPSLAAIAVLPPLFYLQGWRAGFEGEGRHPYAPQLVAGMPVVLSHGVGTDVHADAQVQWSVDVCADCVPQLEAVRLADAPCTAAPTRWAAAQGAGGRLEAVLSPPSDAAQRTRCIWVEITRRDGLAEASRWPLHTHP